MELIFGDNRIEPVWKYSITIRNITRYNSIEMIFSMLLNWNTLFPRILDPALGLFGDIYCSLQKELIFLIREFSTINFI